MLLGQLGVLVGLNGPQLGDARRKKYEYGTKEIKRENNNMVRKKRVCFSIPKGLAGNLVNCKTSIFLKNTMVQHIKADTKGKTGQYGVPDQTRT